MTDSSHEPRILICEEGFGSRKILARILSDVGEVDVAINGREALDAVRSARESGEPYDIITLDLMMPEMDGQEALRRIRELEERDHTERATILITTATNGPPGSLCGVPGAVRRLPDQAGSEGGDSRQPVPVWVQFPQLIPPGPGRDAVRTIQLLAAR